MKQYLPFLPSILLFAIGNAYAFVAVVPTSSIRRYHLGNENYNNCVSLEPFSKTALCSEKRKKGGGLDENMKNKLVTESIAPWRTIRLFLYGSLGSGAFIGGLINGSGAIAASNSPDFNLQTEVRTRDVESIKVIQYYVSNRRLSNLVFLYDSFLLLLST